MNSQEEHILNTPHALAGTLALPKHTNDFDTDPDTDWEQTKKRLPNQILITIN
jgi:hypothetical protein